MDYRILCSRLKYGTLICLLIFVFFSCSEKEKSNVSNTYYVELVNFRDSIKDHIANNIFGKVSFFKNNQLQIVSVNYINDDYPDMHYYKSIEDTEAKQPGSKKVRIELKGNYTADSTLYSIQRFKYENDSWVKISDMGFIKATAETWKSAFAEPTKNNELPIKQLGSQVINNLVLSTY